MKRMLVVVVLMLAASCLCFGQTEKKASSKDEKAKQELMQLERDIGKANVSRDYAFFDRVEAEEFIFTDSGGGMTTKKEDLEGVKAPANPDSKLLSYEVDEMKVMLYGKMAVVTGRSTLKGVNKGQEWTGQSRFTDVFVWRDSRWQIVAGHSSRIRTPQPQK
ncbi:MAG: nuclear transport factor 2 family protein [Pyrinomonadaceae bacterium]